MKNLICYCLLLPLLASSVMGQSRFMRKHVRNHGQRVSTHSFAQSFPYGAYLRQIEFTDFQTLQEDRRYLYYRTGDGDLFLYHLGDYFIRHYPVGMQDLETKIAIGEQYLRDKRNLGINNRTNEIYRIIGYFILGKVSQMLESEIRQGNVSESDPRIEQAIQRLAKSKVYVSVEKGSLDKIISNLQNGNVSYIFDRIYLKLIGFMGVEYSYVWFALMGLATMLFLMKRTRKFALILFLAVNAGAGGIHMIKRMQRSSSGSDGAYTPLRSPRYSLKLDQNYYANRGGDPGMMVMKVRDENQRQIGYSVWMLRPQLKASYFAYQDVYRKYQSLRRNQQVVLATTGGFTNAQRQPEGLTVENGNIVNAVIMPDRHGLVVVERNGGIRVINLKRDKIRLPLNGTQSKEIENPLHNLIAYSELLSWCREHRATLFQTQLLAYGNRLLIDSGKSPSQMRERRILVGFRDNNSKQVHHAIFHIPDPHNLAILSEEIFMMVRNRDKKIEFMLNLDVGTYDILHVQDPRGNLLPHVKGPKDIRNATNLIVWRY